LTTSRQKLPEDQPHELMPIARAGGKLTIETANQSMQVSRIKKEHGIEAIEAMLSCLITETLMYVKHDPSHWSATTILSCVDMLMSSFWMFKIKEFTLAFKKGINGEYGKVYGNIAYTDLVEWLNCYDKEKSKHAEQLKGIDTPKERMETAAVVGSYKEYVKAMKEKMLEKSQEDDEGKQLDRVEKLKILVPDLSIGELRSLVRQLVRDDRTSEEIEIVSNRINELTQTQEQ